MIDRFILLVEDNPLDIELSLRAFRKAGIPDSLVSVVRDGQDALDFLFREGTHAGRSPHRTPSVMFLDVRLPKLDGIEVLRRVRGDPRTSFLPVVMLTAAVEDEVRLSSYALWANGFIHKPVTPERFGAAVEALGLYWLTLNEPPPVAEGF